MLAPMSTLPLRAAVRPRERSLPLPPPELTALLVLAAFLYLWALGRNGFANEYYAAAVRAMSESWHAFLYGSFDAAGVMTVDKPPMALWVQALSARVFGFGSLSLLIPQALMGVATVGLVYDLVRRRFGRAGGFVAGLALAVTPITVAIARHNNPDALLILCCAGALWCLVRGLEDGRTRWIVLAGALVGLGFETKMAVALMVVPGIALAWLWVAPRGRGAAVRQLLAGGAALVVVGGAWPLLLALTPADQRPWVSGTSDNSILSLMLEYNGFGRLSGQAGGPAGLGGAGGVFGGEPGLWRLIDASLGAQAGWLLGFAVVGGVAILLASRLRRADPRTGWLIAVGGAFATSAVAFSTAKGIFHPYYVSFLAPWTAALVGAGAAQLSGRDRAARVLAPLALVAGVACEIAVMRATGALSGWAPWLAAGVVFAGVVLVAAGSDRVRRAALAAALALLALAPAAWGVQTLGHATNGVFPAGGPAAMAGGLGRRRAGGRRRRAAGCSAAGRLRCRTRSPTSRPTAAARWPCRASRPRRPPCSRPAPTSPRSAASPAARARSTPHGSPRPSSSGRIRWVLVEQSGGMPDDGRTGSRAVMAAVEATCTATSVDGLYDCAGAADALARAG